MPVPVTVTSFWCICICICLLVSRDHGLMILPMHRSFGMVYKGFRKGRPDEGELAIKFIDLAEEVYVYNEHV